MRRKMGRRARERWFLLRYDILVEEGFTPEESLLVANTRISSPQMRRLRRIRKTAVQNYVNKGYTNREANLKVREDIRGTQDEIVDWESFVRILYP